MWPNYTILHKLYFSITLEIIHGSTTQLNHIKHNIIIIKHMSNIYISHQSYFYYKLQLDYIISLKATACRFINYYWKEIIPIYLLIFTKRDCCPYSFINLNWNGFFPLLVYQPLLKLTFTPTHLAASIERNYFPWTFTSTYWKELQTLICKISLTSPIDLSFIHFQTHINLTITS